MVPVPMKLILRLQLLAFLLYGMVSGAAISQMIKLKQQEARTQAISALLVALPVSALCEIDI